MPGHRFVFVVLLLEGALAGCAGSPVADVDPADVVCPDLSGTYCAVGRDYKRGDYEVTPAHLGWFLPSGHTALGGGKNSPPVDRVELRGGHDGQLGITAFAADEQRFQLTLQEQEFRCGASQLLVENPGQPWGGGIVGPLPILALGWSEEQSLLWKADDGSLRARKLRRHSGMVMGIPASFRDEYWARFRLAEQGCE